VYGVLTDADGVVAREEGVVQISRRFTHTTVAGVSWRYTF